MRAFENEHVIGLASWLHDSRDRRDKPASAYGNDVVVMAWELSGDFTFLAFVWDHAEIFDEPSVDAILAVPQRKAIEIFLDRMKTVFVRDILCSFGDDIQGTKNTLTLQPFASTPV